MIAKIPRSILILSPRSIFLSICNGRAVVHTPKTWTLSYGNDSLTECCLAQPIDWMEPELENCEHEGILDCLCCEKRVRERKMANISDWISPAFVQCGNAVMKGE